MTSAVVNVEQAAAWNGAGGEHWVTQEERYNAAVAGYQRRLRQAAAIRPGEPVLDVGCGCGESTRDAARDAAPATALGIDLSARMIERARRRAADEGLANVRYECADAQVHPFPAATFQVAVSRFGATFFVDPVAAFANIGRALAPGGRLVLFNWQELARNEWLVAIRAALALALGRTFADPPVGVPGPFGLADPHTTEAVLAAADFTDIDITGVAEPVWLGADPASAAAYLDGVGYVRGFLDGLDQARAGLARQRLTASLAAHHDQHGVRYDSAAWLVTARRA